MNLNRNAPRNGMLKATLTGGSVALTLLSIGVLARNEGQAAAVQPQLVASFTLADLPAIPTLMPLPTASPTPEPVLMQPTSAVAVPAATPLETDVPTATATPTLTPVPTATPAPVQVMPPVRSRSSR
ncbi:MAG: hypothetical protein ABTQ73_01220 [Caldilineales bacterium]